MASERFCTDIALRIVLAEQAGWGIGTWSDLPSSPCTGYQSLSLTNFNGSIYHSSYPDQCTAKFDLKNKSWQTVKTPEKWGRFMSNGNKLVYFFSWDMKNRNGKPMAWWFESGTWKAIDFPKNFDQPHEGMNITLFDDFLLVGGGVKWRQGPQQKTVFQKKMYQYDFSSTTWTSYNSPKPTGFESVTSTDFGPFWCHAGGFQDGNNNWTYHSLEHKDVYYGTYYYICASDGRRVLWPNGTILDLKTKKKIKIELPKFKIEYSLARPFIGGNRSGAFLWESNARWYFFDLSSKVTVPLDTKNGPDVDNLFFGRNTLWVGNALLVADKGRIKEFKFK